MDSHRGNEQQIPIDIQKPHLHTPVGLHQHSSGHRQGSIQPGGADHSAVTLGVQPDKFAGQLPLVLDLEAGIIAVGGGNAEAGIVLLVAEGNEGAAVPADKIALSLFRIPFFAFFELGIALLFQIEPQELGNILIVLHHKNGFCHGVVLPVFFCCSINNPIIL